MIPGHGARARQSSGKKNASESGGTGDWASSQVALVALVDEAVGGIDPCPEQVPCGHLNLVAIQHSAQAAGQEVVDLLERVVVLASRPPVACRGAIWATNRV